VKGEFDRPSLSIDLLVIKGRVPEAAQGVVRAAIDQAIVSLEATSIESFELLEPPLERYPRLKFACGLAGGLEDMRLTFEYDEARGTATVWDLGFRDARSPRDFYRGLGQRDTLWRI
jgi:hypothetical protein